MKFRLKKGIAEAVSGMDRETKVIIPGGLNEKKKLNSVGMFSLATKTWISLQTMKEYRSEASSVVYNNQIVVTGSASMFMEKSSLMNAVQVDQST